MSRANNRPDRSKAKRTPVGRRNVLVADENPGYKRRWVNDEPGRIQMFEEAGYRIVEGQNQSGQKNVGQASQVGSVARKPVGGGTNAVLMEISDDWYKEDQAAKEAQLKEKEQGLLNDEKGQKPDQSNLYGEGLKIRTNREMPTIQAE